MSLLSAGDRKQRDKLDFFIAHISRERASDVKLRFYITREKTAVSVSFNYRFPVIFLLSAASRCLAATECRWFVPCVVRAEGGESRRLWVPYTLDTGY